MPNLLKDLSEFQERFHQPIRKDEALPNKSLVSFRIKFLLEELDELAKAANANDLVEMTDALVDIVYVALGMAWQLSLPFPQAWDEVHKANMRKEAVQRSSDSKRGYQFDIIKPKDWTPPNLSQFFTPEELAMKNQPVVKDERQHDLITYLNEMKEREAHEQDARPATA